MRLTEERSTFVGTVPKLMAEDPKGALGVAETAGDLDRGLLFDEEGAKRFILTLQRKLGRKEEMPIWGSRYSIRSAGGHNQILLPKHSDVKMFDNATAWGTREANNEGKDHRSWRKRSPSWRRAL
jgi:hypothetical protein